MKRDPLLFIDDILESINLINEYLQGVTEEQFHVSIEKQDSIVRRIEIIGEATKNLPDDFKEKYPETPWKDMAGMRDKIIHQYFGINFMTVWDTAKNMLPPLKVQIEEVLKDYEKK